jgi:hypothetical protein
VKKSDDENGRFARKNAAKAAKTKKKLLRQYDDALPPKTEEDMEVRKFFSEMKKREFQKVPSGHTYLSGSR